MNTYTYENMHGKNIIPGMTALVPALRWKEIKGANRIQPRSSNGLNDPFTYYHVLDGLLNVVADEQFRTREFTDYLLPRPIDFDVITVGRVIADISESLFLANGRRAIVSGRSWDGMRHMVCSWPEDRKAMENLLEDLYKICKAEPKKRNESPMYECPSVILV